MQVKNLFDVLKKQKILKSIFLHSLTVLISVLVVFAITNAGSLSPTLSPASTFYTLADIYTRLTTNATATEANHDLNTSNSPASTFYTLKQIYDVIPTIDPAKVNVGTTYLGVTGTLLGNMWNGTAGITVLPAGAYPQSLGGVEDWNRNTVMPVDTYKSTWVSCHAGSTPNDAGNNYCGTNDTNADKLDVDTGLIWSKMLNNGVSHRWFWANNCAYPNGLPGDDGVCNSNGEVACQCVKLTSNKTGCEAQDGWHLPYQKELMQAYINGSWSGLSPGTWFYWASTTASQYTERAWFVDISSGNTVYSNKTNYNQTLCVRSIYNN